MPNKLTRLATASAGLLWALAALGLAPAQAADRAADNYRTYCVQCHGIDGNGQGINKRDMSVQPRDHTDAKAMSGRSDETIFKVIKEGGPSIDKSVLMPPWVDTFSDEEIRELVVHLRKLCKCSFGAGS